MRKFPSGNPLPVLIHPHHEHLRGTDDLEGLLSYCLLADGTAPEPAHSMVLDIVGTSLRELDAIPLHLFWSVGTRIGRLRMTQSRCVRTPKSNFAQFCGFT